MVVGDYGFHDHDHDHDHDHVHDHVHDHDLHDDGVHLYFLT